LPSALAGAVLLLAADVATRLVAFGPEMKPRRIHQPARYPVLFLAGRALAKNLAMTELATSI
jgi:ABC-type Fe3+-siderophore transport system permease subunit